MRVLLYVFLLCAAGLVYNNPALRRPDRWFSAPVSHVATRSVMEFVQRKDVEMYSLSTCGHCENQARAMVAAGITFTRYNIDRDAGRMQELNQRLINAGQPPGGGVPILFVGSTMFRGETPVSQLKAVIQ